VTGFKSASALGLAVLLWAHTGSAQERSSEASDSSAKPTFAMHGYAVINYYNFAWQTDPRRRDAVDLERFVVEPSLRLNARLEFEAEVEFEHGGTGATLEFDPFEESGEFEQEVEKGGEIVIEKLQATYTWNPKLGIRVGRLYVPVGTVSSHDEPDEYFTTARNEAESALIPTIWHEPGLELFGRMGRLGYRALVVTGLDATGFSSANWIRGGFQQRFETVNASNLAAVGRLELAVGNAGTVALSGYYGNSAGNRPKADLQVPAYVGILSADAHLARGPFSVRGLMMYGHLQNSGVVSAANRNLSNALGVKRTPVGSAALAWFGEVGYDLLPALSHARSAAGQRLDLFARYDWYDTMYHTADGIFDNPRWERHAVTGGVNWRPDPHFIVKAQYSHRTVGLPSENREDTASLGVALLF
jgi:hypothetical protein